ncbi:MAG: LysR family transcriptional regulator [Verrucomicrobiota bacterium]
MFENLFAHRGLSLDRLRSFLEVAEAGSIVGAVDGDPVRQSQYSRQIGELESFFGVELVRRAGKRLQLTPRGKQLAAAARAQLQGLSDFQQACQNAPLNFHIGAGDSLLQWLIIPQMSRFQELFPRTKLFLYNHRSRDIAERLVDLRLDFGVARASIIGAPLSQYSLGSVTYGLFVPKKIQKGVAQWSDERLLQELPWVTLGSDGELMEKLVRACLQKKIQINFSLITESFPQAARAVHSGCYAAILPLHAENDFDPSEIVVKNSPFLKTCARKVVLAWNPKMLTFRPGADSAREFLQKYLRLKTNR